MLVNVNKVYILVTPRMFMAGTNCSMCVHFYICAFEKCGKCGQHLHDGGRYE